MSRSPQPPRSTARDAQDDAVAVVSAYGAYRVLVILLAIWSFFAGFALLTQGVTALSFGGQDAGAERVIGAHMLIMVPLYVLLAWKRAEYRRLVWVPYAAQLAVIVPTGWSLLTGGGFDDGVLMLLIASIFFALLLYVSWSSHPLDFFRGDAGEDDEGYEEYDDEEEPEEEDPDGEEEPQVDARGRRYRRSR